MQPRLAMAIDEPVANGRPIRVEHLGGIRLRLERLLVLAHPLPGGFGLVDMRIGVDYFHLTALSWWPIRRLVPEAAPLI